MPIHWKILHSERLVVATTEGVVTLNDVEPYLDAVVTEDAMPYAKIFDATDIDPRASDDDVMMLAARMRAYVATIEGGPLAFVVTTPEARAFVDRYLNLTAAQRPVRIFARLEDAQEWLHQLAR
jgi:hypothetical protein